MRNRTTANRNTPNNNVSTYDPGLPVATKIKHITELYGAVRHEYSTRTGIGYFETDNGCVIVTRTWGSLTTAQSNRIFQKIMGRKETGQDFSAGVDALCDELKGWGEEPTSIASFLRKGLLENTGITVALTYGVAMMAVLAADITNTSLNVARYRRTDQTYTRLSDEVAERNLNLQRKINELKEQTEPERRKINELEAQMGILVSSETKKDMFVPMRAKLLMCSSAALTLGFGLGRLVGTYLRKKKSTSASNAGSEGSGKD
jgi:hypothetical protein